MTTEPTQRNQTRDVQRDQDNKDALFLKFPEQYYQYAVQWCAYPHWTIEEAANLLTGCVPHREMLLKGEAHQQLDQEVLITENRIRAAMHDELEVVRSRKYFGKTYLKSEEILDWAKTINLVLPDDLIRAEQLIRNRYQSETYTTPCLEAIRWVVENFWEHANLREPPSSGAIIQALLQKYPELSGVECDWIEKVTRHPVTRLDEP